MNLNTYLPDFLNTNVELVINNQENNIWGNGIGMSTVHKWIKMYRDTKSFKEVDQLQKSKKKLKNYMQQLIN